MLKLEQRGEINTLLIPFILVILLLIGAGSFAVWAYMGRQDYKDHSDQKVAAAVGVAKQQEDAVKDKAFAEQEKLPLKPYNGPSAYGSIKVMYPKTWSGYVDDSGNSGAALDGFFYPGVVPSIQKQSSSFALRMQVSSGSYSDFLTNNFAGYVQTKQVTVTPFSFKNVPGAVGVRLDGAIEPGKTGSMVMVPLRDKTLRLWTDTPEFLNDFNNNILPNVSFSP
jgi:hypothetical protein